MRDPFSWSFPVGRLFGITVRIHFLFPIVAAGLIMREAFAKDAVPDAWRSMTLVMALLFFSVLLHELGHCFMARRVGGEANEVLLWPLGGLAAVDVPHSARANFLVAAGGPLVNLLLFVGSSAALQFAFDMGYRPFLSPFSAPYAGGKAVVLAGGMEHLADLLAPASLLTLFAWVNLVLLLFNLVLVGYPMDSGRMLQCGLWPHVGYRQSTIYAVYAGFFTMFILLLVCLAWNEVMLILLAFFIYASCTQQWQLLESGGDDSLFGYDFSQGYTSLEKNAPAPPRRKQPNFFQRWLQRRAARKLQAEQQRQLEEENRMDQLLEKIQRYGKDSLTEEEHRFLKKVADRYRNRP